MATSQPIYFKCASTRLDAVRLVKQRDLEARDLRPRHRVALVVFARFVAERGPVQLALLVHRRVHTAGGYVVHAHTTHAHPHQGVYHLRALLRHQRDDTHGVHRVGAQPAHIRMLADRLFNEQLPALHQLPVQLVVVLNVRRHQALDALAAAQPRRLAEDSLRPGTEVPQR